MLTTLFAPEPEKKETVSVTEQDALRTISDQMIYLQSKIALAYKDARALQALQTIGKKEGLSASLMTYAQATLPRYLSHGSCAAEGFDAAPIKDKTSNFALETIGDKLKAVYEYIIKLLIKVKDAFVAYVRKSMNQTRLAVRDFASAQEKLIKVHKNGFDEDKARTITFTGMRKDRLQEFALALSVDTAFMRFDPTTISATEDPVDVYNRRIDALVSSHNCFTLNKGRNGDASIIVSVDPIYVNRTNGSLLDLGYTLSSDAQISEINTIINNVIKNIEEVGIYEKSIDRTIEKCKQTYKESGVAGTKVEDGIEYLGALGRVGSAMTVNARAYIEAAIALLKAVTEVMNQFVAVAKE